MRLKSRVSEPRRSTRSCNGKIERWYKALKSECLHPRTSLSLENARHLIEDYVEHYNNVRLNSATGYIRPRDKLVGRRAGDSRQTRSKVGSSTESNGEFAARKPP